MLVICINLISIIDYYQCLKFLYNDFFFRPVAQFWLERRIDIAEVDGSVHSGLPIFITAINSYQIYPDSLQRLLYIFVPQL